MDTYNCLSNGLSCCVVSATGLAPAVFTLEV